MFRCALACLAVLALAPAPGSAQSSAARPLIADSIDPSRLVTLAGNTRPEAMDPASDRGPVADTLPLPHLLLQLRRPAEREMALAQLVDRLHEPASPDFHHWLDARHIGAAFGPAPEDLETVAGWLRGQGFSVDFVYPSGMLIDFSGTAGQVRGAFHTELHHFEVGGEPHIANVGDPQVPEALAPAIAGIVSLHDFRPQPQFAARAEYTPNASGIYSLVPADLATIYDFNPAFAAGTTGRGQTIVAIEDTDLFDTADWSVFRATLGLSSYAGGSLTTVHPGDNCRDPGVNRDDSEAIIDAEWASAAAPDAAIVIASCANSRTTFGGLLAIENLVNGPIPPAIIGLSYGECEAFNGAAANAAFNSVWQQAAAEGVSVFVSSGDSDAALCTQNPEQAAYTGVGVSGFASSPYAVATGGTDFADTDAGATALYWSPTNLADYASALSYIPEIPWNDSCGSELLAVHLGFAGGFGAKGLCNSALAQRGHLLNIVGGSGGPSGCATGAPAQRGIVGGSCQGYAKPAWQRGVPGNPKDGVRDLPDLSLFASNGIWGHYFVVCFSGKTGGKPCVGDPGNWSAFGGTSFTAQILAGVQALVNQAAGSAQGDPNYVYYRIAAAEFAGGCVTSNGCVFHQVTAGDIDAPCYRFSPDCFAPAGEYGVLSTKEHAFAPAFAAGPGWNFATGLGSIDVANLLAGWQADASRLTRP